VGAEKILRRVLSGTADAAIRLDDLCQLLESLGFEKRVRGSDHLFGKSGVEGMINLQSTGLGDAIPGQTGPGYNLENQTW
jgi:hypothetical protein